MLNKPKIIVISGPSGVGKSTICNKLIQHPLIVHAISATTRSLRKGETDEIDYFFLSKEVFEAKITNNDFVEYAEVAGNYYGTLKKEIIRITSDGKYPLLDIDVQGATQLKQKGIDAVYIFIAPPSMDELEKRLRGRATDNEDVINKRLELAKSEMDKQELYDTIIINKDIDNTVKDVLNFVGLKS